ncbi:MAG TPA: hypothetical protein VGJ48_25335 [Pyrinomonadaceae bacterium]|jgi:hypothetical protein
MRLLWLFSELLGYAGGALILYGIVAARANAFWPPVEQIAAFSSSLLTILGALVTAGSIYLHGTRPPWKHSRSIVAPVVIGSCVAAIYFLYRLGQLPPVVVSGFGLLAISGGLKRLLPYPEDPN